MATPDPAAVAEKLAIKVAGGHTIKSVFPLSSLAPAMIFTSSPHEAMRPFIFQLPATSGTMLAAIENPLTACGYQTGNGNASAAGDTLILLLLQGVGSVPMVPPTRLG